MRSKLRAAKVASEAGASVAIANGRHDQAIPWALERKIGTYFPPHRRKSVPWQLVSQTSDLDPRQAVARARSMRLRLAQLTTAEKNAILLAMADAIIGNAAEHHAKRTRADLDNFRTDRRHARPALAQPRADHGHGEGVREVASLPDPVGETLAEWTRPNGLRIRKVRVPLGVVGVIYESRPNVTVDTVSLALKTGNAIVLRGGKEAVHSNEQTGRNHEQRRWSSVGAIELLDSSTRDSVQELIKARGLVDVLIPRGGPGLISFVTENATVPVIETGAGNCHIFVDESADFAMADAIVINAKTQRPSVCNAAEKLLVHQSIAAEYVPRIVKAVAGQWRRSAWRRVKLAAWPTDCPSARRQLEDWSEEYLRLCIAIRVVASVEEAIDHINRYSTKNSEAIVTRDEARARLFQRLVDSAVVYWNASTRFSDGGEFGFGAEMGISTQKLHCRGPFALAELTSSKYEVTGSGQVR